MNNYFENLDIIEIIDTITNIKNKLVKAKLITDLVYEESSSVINRSALSQITIEKSTPLLEVISDNINEAKELLDKVENYLTQFQDC